MEDLNQFQQQQPKVQPANQQQQLLKANYAPQLNSPGNPRVYIAMDALVHGLRNSGFIVVEGEKGLTRSGDVTPGKRVVTVERGTKSIIITAHPPRELDSGGAGTSFMVEPLPTGPEGICMIGRYTLYGGGSQEVEPCYVPIDSTPRDILASPPLEILEALNAAFRQK